MSFNKCLKNGKSPDAFVHNTGEVTIEEINFYYTIKTITSMIKGSVIVSPYTKDLPDTGVPKEILPFEQILSHFTNCYFNLFQPRKTKESLLRT